MRFPYDAERFAVRSEKPWQGDSLERHNNELPHPQDVVTALMVVGYETLYDSPAPPSAVFANFASDLQVYVLGRSLKMPHDAMEVFLQKHEDRPHIQDFLTQAFEVVEDAHAKGLATRALFAQLETQSARFVQLQYDLSDKHPAVSNSELAIKVWQEALMEMQESELSADVA